MPEQPYSNREIDAKFKNIEDVSVANRDTIMEGIGEINAHLTELNHSVVSLKLWRAYLTGAIAVIGLASTIAITIITAYISSGKL